MKTRILFGLGLAFLALVALAPVPATAGQRLFAVQPLSLAPPASAAPRGSWTMVPDYGYMWLASDAAMDAEWAPWDPWWVLPSGRWCFVPGFGWGWFGWAGFAGIPGPDPYQLTDMEVATIRNYQHPGKGHDAPPKVKVTVVVAAPPPTMIVPVHRFDDQAQLNGSGPTGRADGKNPGQAGKRKEKGHVRTWDEIIAARQARGVYGPPVHGSNSGDGGGNYSGPSYHSGHRLTILPSQSTGSSKQK